MPALVVFDCFGTLVSSPDLPGPEQVTAAFGDTLGLSAKVATEVVRTVYGRLARVMADPAAVQPATRDLMDAALRAQRVEPDPATVDRALWNAFGCADPGRYGVCEPAAEAARRAHAAGHTLRLLSNCFLPGELMEKLLRRTGVPDLFDRAVFTADGGPKKPAPEAFALVGAGQFDRRVMVGDSREFDLAPAAALGWSAVEVGTGGPVPEDFFRLLDL